MFEEEIVDGEAFVVKQNHHNNKKWNDFERRYNKARYKFHGRPYISRTHNGIPYWDYPPRMNLFRNGWIYCEQELITTHFNGPRWAKWYRSRNGKTEWGYVWDAWGKPFVQGKSSRVAMKLKKQWRTEADEYYEALSTLPNVDE